jgi:hypothetical protein
MGNEIGCCCGRGYRQLHNFVGRQLYGESLKQYILYYFEVIGDSEATIGRGFVGLDYCIQDLSSRLASL